MVSILYIIFEYKKYSYFGFLWSLFIQSSPLYVTIHAPFCVFTKLCFYLLFAFFKFNLSIKDLAQITSMTKVSLGNVESLFNSNSPFCIEISLRTPENQTMILETWCILFNDQLVDSTQKVCYNVYKKMSLVLRSLMCITRSTPTYQLSRRQSSDAYVLLYRMYCGEPIVHHLGENYATSKVGTVGTPIGSILVNLAYRTRLTMTPQNSSHANDAAGIQIKEEHFSGNQRLDSPSGMCRNSPTDLIYNESNASPRSPSITDKSPRFAGKSNIYIYIYIYSIFNKIETFQFFIGIRVLKFIYIPEMPV